MKNILINFDLEQKTNRAKRMQKGLRAIGFGK